MKTLQIKAVLLCALLFFVSGFSFAADKNYKNTTVWHAAFITTEPGQGDMYLDTLKTSYTTLMEEAKKENIVLSYKILVGDRANPQDWDIMILIEYPNWAAFDTAEAKFDAIREKYHGSMEKADANDKREMTDRAKIRTIFGGKTLQEIQFVK